MRQFLTNLHQLKSHQTIFIPLHEDSLFENKLNLNNLIIISTSKMKLAWASWTINFTKTKPWVLVPIHCDLELARAHSYEKKKKSIQATIFNIIWPTPTQHLRVAPTKINYQQYELNHSIKPHKPSWQYCTNNT